jgi:hypothetical protein
MSSILGVVVAFPGVNLTLSGACELSLMTGT